MDAPGKTKWLVQSVVCRGAVKPAAMKSYSQRARENAESARALCNEIAGQIASAKSFAKQDRLRALLEVERKGIDYWLAEAEKAEKEGR
jgi:hypothetical protein